MKRSVIAGLLIVCALTAGCRSKIKQDLTVEVRAGRLKMVELSPAKSLTIEFTSKDNVPVTATLAKAEDANAAIDAMEKEDKTIDQAMSLAKSMGMQSNVPRGTLTTPKSEDKTKYAVLFTSTKDTTVTVKITGQ